MCEREGLDVNVGLLGYIGFWVALFNEHCTIQHAFGTSQGCSEDSFDVCFGYKVESFCNQSTELRESGDL